MIDFNINDLLNFVKKKFPEAKIQKETNQVLVIYKVHNVEFPTFFRLVQDGELLQILSFMPLKLKERTIGDLSRVLHLINKEVDIPGFGIDEESHIAFYRIMLPFFDKKIEESLVDAYLGSIQMLLDTFFPMIMAVNEGIATFKDVMKKVQENKGK